MSDPLRTRLPVNPVSPSRLLYESRTMRAGRFEIAPEAPGFDSAGQMLRSEFVFPRAAVWIEPASGSPFAADPTLATLYNAGEPYRRRAIAREGDRCDWFAFAPELLVEIVSSVDPTIRERPDRPFRRPSAPVDDRALILQRLVSRRLIAGETGDGLAIEETMLEVLRRLIAATAPRRPALRPPAPRSSPGAEEVKAYLAPRISEPLTLDRIAGVFGCSPFHLCRRFKEETGRTLHGWRVAVRLRQSLDRVAEANGDLAAIALDAGFATHSHFTTAFRRAFGVTPSAYRRLAGRHPLRTRRAAQ